MDLIDPEPYTVKRSAADWAARNNIICRLAKTARADLGLRYFDIRKATGVDDAFYEPFQIEILNGGDLFDVDLKSRQIGASFGTSGDALMDGMIKGRHTVISVSFNLEEAKEKVRYVGQWWEARHPNPELVPARSEFDDYGNWRGESPYRIRKWPELIKSNAIEMEWDNGFRFISNPCRPPRGKQASVILDEFAHYGNNDVPIMTAAFPMITRGLRRKRNRLSLVSTGLGARGRFWEVYTNTDQYPDYARHAWGWWDMNTLVKDRQACIKEFLTGADAEYLVRKYGSAELKLIFRNNILEDFLQEYGLQFLDDAHNFLSWELIKSCYPVDWNAGIDEDEEAYEAAVASGFEGVYFSRKGRGFSEALEVIRDLDRAVRSGLIEEAMVFAFDCGRDRDVSEISIFGLDFPHFRQRGIITMPQLEFEKQEAVLTSCIRDLPMVRGMLDKGGLGRQIAERIENRFGYEYAGVQFSAPLKEKWANNGKLAMQRRKVTLIPDREQEQQLHSIKRKITDAKNMKYEIEDDVATVGGGKKIKHHADKFWAVMMALWLASELERISGAPGPSVDTESASKAATVPKVTKAKGFGGPRSASSSALGSHLEGKMGRRGR